MNFEMPSLPGKNEYTINEMYIKKGDYVQKNQMICQIETSKSTRELLANFEGVITEISVQLGDKISKGDTICKYDCEQVTEIESTSDLSIDIHENLNTDLVVIGAGPGGYVSAIYAAKRGLDVILIEKDNLGGTCLNVGCIPTKTLVQTAENFQLINQLEIFGIESCLDAKVNMQKVQEHKNEVIDTLKDGIDALLEQNQVKVIKGAARFIDDNTMKVNNTTIQATNIIIATGSKPNALKIPGYSLSGVIDSTEALSLNEIPQSMTIIGGGVIGLEFAFIYQSFGTKVHIIEFQDEIIPMFDHDASREISRIAQEKGIRISTSSRVTEIKNTVENAYAVTYAKGDNIETTVSDIVLMTTGRIANTDGLELNNTTVVFDQHDGHIVTNGYCQTNVEHIYAIGDVTSNLKLAHVASHQGMIAIDHIKGNLRKLNELHVPSVVYTHPEIAMVGYSEELLKEQNISYTKSYFDFQGNGKALTMNQTEGYIKLLADLDGQLLGGLIIGPDASSLIASLTIAIENEVSVEDLTQTIFAHPTTAEVIHEASLSLLNRGIHS